MGLDITIKTSRHEIDFRKHNYLMPWMKNIIEGEVKNCEEYEITKDQLEDLLANVESVLNDHSKASILLPTQGGFFGEVSTTTNLISTTLSTRTKNFRRC